MDALLSVNWIALLVLMIALLSFKALNWIAYRVNWTVVILISMVIGAVIGVVFASEGNTYLVWLNLIGQAYVKLIKALVAPVILVSVISGLISLNDKEKMKKIGTKSVFWLLITSVTAIVVTLVVGAVTNIGKGAGAVFADISSVTDATLSAYQEMETSFDTILLNLVPSNIAADLAADNIVAIIIIAVAVAVAYVSISSEEGEDKVLVIKKLIEAVKKVIFNILAYVIDLTPHAVLCLTACSASQLLSDKEALVQLVLLVVMVFVACLIQSYVVNAVILKSFAKVNPLKFFKKTFDAQATAFTTTSSVGTMPITIDRLIRKVGVDEEVAKHLNSMSVEVVVAPDFDEKAIELFKDNSEIKLVKLNTLLKDYRKMTCEEVIMSPFGALVQDSNNSELDKDMFKVVTREKPTAEQIEDAIFAWKVVKHAKTNAAVIARDFKTSAIAQGQTNALAAVEWALNYACDNSKEAVLASDAPIFAEDCIYSAIQGRIGLIIQPGGAIKDQKIIETCDKYGIAMITTGVRNYRQ